MQPIVRHARPVPGRGGGGGGQCGQAQEDEGGGGGEETHGCGLVVVVVVVVGRVRACGVCVEVVGKGRDGISTEKGC